MRKANCLACLNEIIMLMQSKTRHNKKNKKKTCSEICYSCNLLD